jgi:hypothetical protein
MRESLIYRPKIGQGMRRRYARIKLLYGGYVGVSGRPQSYAGPAAIFKYEQACQFLRDTGPIEKSDYLWGASIEMLEKRKSWISITDEQFERMVKTTALARLESKAAEYERLAASSRSMLKHYEQEAMKYASKANEIRHRLEKEKV